MKSIVEDNHEKKCFFCGSVENLHKHHIFFGNPYRKLSEKNGLTVHLCLYCHEGDNGVHRNYEKNIELKQIGQAKFEECHSHDEFMQIFGKNWL